MKSGVRAGGYLDSLVRRRAARQVAAVLAAMLMATASTVFGAVDLAFRPHADGGFEFDTGTIRGRLRVDGKSLGLQRVEHVATGRRLDRSNGLLSHYRVFSGGRRFGAGAWDWPSRASSGAGGSVEIVWPEATDRPFELRAVYRLADASTVELETSVKAIGALAGFESFVAAYFEEGFTNALVWVAGEAGGEGQFDAAVRAAGDWQMFPRDSAAEGLIRDGRWKLEPHPVDWTVRSRFLAPVAVRRASAVGLSGILMAPRDECFALSMPYETEGHYSTYFSIFGRDLKAGETARARVRLSFTVAEPTEAGRALYREAEREWGSGK